MGAPEPLSAVPGERPLVSDPWVTPEELSNCSASQDVDLMTACVVASHVLYSLTGNKFGVRQDKVRPVGLTADACIGVYSDGGREVKLNGPVRTIDQVKVDGRVLSPDEYMLYGRRLIRRDGHLWPVGQYLYRTDDDAGTCSITYQWGQNVPPSGKIAAQQFACEIAKYLANDQDCRLPDRILSVTRQGLTYTKIDPSQFIEQSRTGLYLVDQWIGSVGAGRRKPGVMSPDSIKLIRETSLEDSTVVNVSKGTATYVGSTLPADHTDKYVWYHVLGDGTVDLIVEDGV